eukprot:s756_g14.t1
MSEWTARQLPLPCRWAVNETYLAIQCTFQAVSLPFPARECQRKLSDGWKLSHPADGRSVWQSCSRQLFAGDTELAAAESKRIGKKLHPAIHRLYRLLLCHLGRRFFALLLSSSLDSSATNSSRCLDWAPLEASKKAETACSCCSVFRAEPDTLLPEPPQQDAAEKKGSKVKKPKKGKEEKEKGKEEKEKDKAEAMSQEPKDSKESTKSSKSKSKENKEPEASVDEQAGAAPDDQFIGKFHSALRWGKAEDEVQALVTDASVSRRSAARAPDPKTGNQALHIAVQNGHRELTQLLIAWKADVTAQNFKGQTPLHMSVEYDFYFISKLLLEKGAKREVENSDGCQAILGISGSKEGAEAWDAPINILKNAANREEIELAYNALEGADPTSLDKASLARIGMLKAKEMPDVWDKGRFVELLNKV